IFVDVCGVEAQIHLQVSNGFVNTRSGDPVLQRVAHLILSDVVAYCLHERIPETGELFVNDGVLEHVPSTEVEHASIDQHAFLGLNVLGSLKFLVLLEKRGSAAARKIQLASSSAAQQRIRHFQHPKLVADHKNLVGNCGDMNTGGYDTLVVTELIRRKP